MKSSGSTRSYHQTARAAAVREREEAILEAAFEAFFSEYYDQVTLRGIAEQAGVTEQTVIRRFGSKEDLLATVVQRFGRRLGEPRGNADPGEYRAAVREAVESYERNGRRILQLLAQEDRTPALERATDAGRAGHRAETARVFAPWLPPADDPAHAAALGPFVVALDVFTWRLLRLDMDLSREDTERVVTRMVEGLIAGPTTRGGEV